jgi:hypothetical protein
MHLTDQLDLMNRQIRTENQEGLREEGITEYRLGARGKAGHDTVHIEKGPGPSLG